MPQHNISRLEAAGIPRPELVGAALLREVAKLRKRCPDATDPDMAQALMLPLDIYVGRMAWATNEYIKDLQIYDVASPLSVSGDFVIVGDVHVPFCDWDMAALVEKVARRAWIKQLVISGDFFNLDIFSVWNTLALGPGWKEEKLAAQRLMQSWAAWFDKIYFLSGNHEYRIARATDGEMNIQDLAEFCSVNVTKLVTSVLGYCYLESGGRQWYIAHGSEYSGANQFAVAQDLAYKEQRNVVLFHQHYLSKGRDKWDRFELVNGGCLVRESALAYKMLHASKRNRFVQGFVVMREGCAELLGRGSFTDWERWL